MNNRYTIDFRITDDFGQIVHKMKKANLKEGLGSLVKFVDKKLGFSDLFG